MSTKDIALRCARAMDSNLLRHKWPADQNKRELYGLSDGQYRHRDIGLIRQLDACRNDEARRLLLGVSERMKEESL